MTGRSALDVALQAYPRIAKLRRELHRNAELRLNLLTELRTVAEFAEKRGLRVQAEVANAVLAEATS